jgi:tetratricopeptide (TPR) repeat protein
MIKQDLAQRYVLTLSHLIRCHIDINQFEEAQQLIAEMRGLEKQKGFNSTDISLRILTISYNAEFDLFHAMGDFAKAKKIAEEIELLSEDMVDKIPKEQAVLFLYYKAYAYFGNGEYKRALMTLNEVLNDNEQRLRQDIYSFARIFNLIIHYELENFDFLEYIVKSTNRYLNKYERDYEIEQCVLKHIRKLAKMITPTQRMEIFEKLKEEVQELMKDPQERVILEYFHLPAWIESKLKKIEFSKAVQQYSQV